MLKESVIPSVDTKLALDGLASSFRKQLSDGEKFSKWAVAFVDELEQKLAALGAADERVLYQVRQARARTADVKAMGQQIQNLIGEDTIDKLKTLHVHLKSVLDAAQVTADRVTRIANNSVESSPSNEPPVAKRRRSRKIAARSD